MGSYWGKILWIDLNSNSVWEEKVHDEIYRQVLGGYGLGLKILLDNQPPNADPLGPENILGFLPGLLSGTKTFFSGRYMVVGKSPLTGGWGDANSGGSFSPEIKRCGYDGIFIRGCSKRPVYIYISDSIVEIRDAQYLWGLDSITAEDTLTKELGSGFRVATIGPAGEKQSLIAGIMNDRGRTAARSGLGAVMGSKQLKAIVIKGIKKVGISNPDLLVDINRTIALPLQGLKKAEKVIGEVAMQWVLPPLLRRKFEFKPSVKMIVDSLKEQGTGSATAISVESGDAPVKNWKGIGMSDFPWKTSSKISDKATDLYKIKKYRCSQCPLGCGALVSVKSGKYATEETHRPEYETAAVFGSNILNADYESIIKINDMCNRFGLDTISTGAVIGFAMECYEKGIIGDADNGGIPLVWGDADTTIQLIEDIALRRGLGDVLADGVLRASKKLGQGSETFAVHSGGQELPMHDPRFQPSYGTTYIVDATPGRHTAGANNYTDLNADPLFGDFKLKKLKKYDYQSKGENQAFFAKQFQVLNCLGLCNFSGFLGTLPYKDMINANTGWDVTDEELMEIGERILIMRQLFNIREGLDPNTVSITDRAVGKPPLEKGPTSGVTVDIETMRLDYYKAMGWDNNGIPSEKRCIELGAAANLYSPTPFLNTRES